MSKNPRAFVALIGTVAIAAFIAVAFVIASAPKARAYAVGSTTSPDVASGSYDFSQSFNDLVSPFVDFFENIQTNGQSFTFGIPTGTGSSGSTNASPVTVNVNVGSYENQFDNWFYQTTGVNIAGVTGAIVEFFSWLFAEIARAGEWIGSWLSHTLPTNQQP